MEFDAKALEVSEFFLVEYSADSEIPTLLESYQHGSDEDDAESCICGSWTDSSLDWEREPQLDGPGGLVVDEGCGTKHNSCRLEPAIIGFVSKDEEEEMVWEGSDKSLRREEVDAMEDRLFWETCMAVGYPIN